MTTQTPEGEGRDAPEWVLLAVAVIGTVALVVALLSDVVPGWWPGCPLVEDSR